MLDSKKIGAVITVLRKKHGYSQEKLAGMFFILKQAVSKWENGRFLPDLSHLPRPAQLFDCSIDDIIMPGYEPNEKKDYRKWNSTEISPHFPPCYTETST